jgi:predicted GIY-YIG superfamily endonuclease
MSKPVLYLVQCQPPSHRGREPRCLHAVPGLNSVLSEVDRERVTSPRFHKPESLPLGHAPQSVLSNFHACVHAAKRTTSDARRYDGSMTEETLALPVELLGSIERYAVYRCYSDSGQLLYVGETGDLGTRLASHAQKLWFVQVRGITLEWYADELDALKAERRAIHVEHPKYNKQHRMTTSVQVARTKPRRRSAKLAPEDRAREILSADPSLSGSELARRLGVSESYGRKIRSFVIDGTPIPGRARSDERS